MTAGLCFVDEQRPRERVGVIVAGTLTGALGAGEWGRFKSRCMPARREILSRPAFGYRQGFRSGSREYGQRR
jgi:hypothetical protein